MKLYIRSGELQDIVSAPTVPECIYKAMERAAGGITLGKVFEVSEQGFDSIQETHDTEDMLTHIGWLMED